MSDVQVRFNFKSNSARKTKQNKTAQNPLPLVITQLPSRPGLLLLQCYPGSLDTGVYIPKTSTVSPVGSLLCVGRKLPIFIVDSGDLTILSASVHCNSLSLGTLS